MIGAPLVEGHSGTPFNPDMRLIEWQRYVNRQLKLSDLGYFLMIGNGDLPDYHPIDRWWGGTRLIYKALWRWDREEKTLLRTEHRREMELAS
ncbi:MAG: hypothetical protein R3D33_06630 [Hyphomicrobiaceae bacterium]